MIYPVDYPIIYPIIRIILAKKYGIKSLKTQTYLLNYPYKIKVILTVRV